MSKTKNKKTAAKKKAGKKSANKKKNKKTKLQVLLGNKYLRSSLVLVCTLLLGLIIGYSLTPTVSVSKHSSLISKYSQAHNINSLLTRAVIQVESSGRPDAVSSAGARGLMQLMPKTAAAMAKELNIPNFKEEDLFIPEVNIRLGTYYLSKLVKRFGHTSEFVIAAYHAGPTRVDQWRKSRGDLSAAGVIQELAFPSTKEYVRRVLKIWNKLATDITHP